LPTLLWDEGRGLWLHSPFGGLCDNGIFNNWEHQSNCYCGNPKNYMQFHHQIVLSSPFDCFAAAAKSVM
jgi:hypothetical protein